MVYIEPIVENQQSLKHLPELLKYLNYSKSFQYSIDMQGPDKVNRDYVALLSV